MMTRREEKKRISTTKISKFQNFKKINEKKKQKQTQHCQIQTTIFTDVSLGPLSFWEPLNCSLGLLRLYFLHKKNLFLV